LQKLYASKKLSEQYVGLMLLDIHILFYLFCRTYRLAAYQQYTAFVHGYLGPNLRKVIPSCCVWAIRHAYPDSDGNYTGFIPTVDELFGMVL